MLWCGGTSRRPMASARRWSSVDGPVEVAGDDVAAGRGLGRRRSRPARRGRPR
jgi:hypothetical protein